jgi:hypothetical protein
MLGNKGGAVNTPPMPEQQAPAPAAKQVAPGELEADKIELTVTDTEGNPLPDFRYVLESPDGKQKDGRTDASGKIRVSESIRGIGNITFPDDPDAVAKLKE